MKSITRNRLKTTTMQGMAAVIGMTALAGSVMPSLAQGGLNLSLLNPDPVQNMDYLSTSTGISHISLYNCSPKAGVEAQSGMFFVAGNFSFCQADVTHDQAANMKIISGVIPQVTGAQLVDAGLDTLAAKAGVSRGFIDTLLDGELQTGTVSDADIQTFSGFIADTVNAQIDASLKGTVIPPEVLKYLPEGAVPHLKASDVADNLIAVRGDYDGTLSAQSGHKILDRMTAQVLGLKPVVLNTASYIPNDYIQYLRMLHIDMPVVSLVSQQDIDRVAVPLRDGIATAGALIDYGQTSLATVNEALDMARSADISGTAARMLGNTFQGGSASGLVIPKAEIMGGIRPELLNMGVVTLSAEASIGAEATYWSGVEGGPQGLAIEPKARIAAVLQGDFDILSARITAYAETNMPALFAGNTPSVMFASGLMNGDLSGLYNAGVTFSLSKNFGVQAKSGQALATDIGLKGGYETGTSFDMLGSDGVAKITTSGSFIGGFTLQQNAAQFGPVSIDAGIDITGGYGTGLRTADNALLTGMINGHLPNGGDLQQALSPYVDELNKLVQVTDFNSLPPQLQQAIPAFMDSLANLPPELKNKLPADVQKALGDLQHFDYKHLPDLIRSLEPQLFDPDYAQLAATLRDSVDKFVSDTNSAWVPTQSMAIYSARVVPMLRASYAMTDNVALVTDAGVGLKATAMTYGSTISVGVQPTAQVDAGLRVTFNTLSLDASAGLSLDGPGVYGTNKGQFGVINGITTSTHVTAGIHNKF